MRCAIRLLLVLLSLLITARPALAQGQFETLKTFVDGTDGWVPAGPIVEGDDGWIYGLTAGYGLPSIGGGSQCASAFRLNPNDGTFQTVWVSGGQGGPGCYVGHGGLVRGGDGNLYFTTSDGGQCGTGQVFKLAPPATVSVVYASFACPGAPFSYPGYGLSVGADGALYGAAAGGGANGRGGIYRLGLDGSISSVGSFSESLSDQEELTPPIQGSDGRFYGTGTAWQNAAHTISLRTLVYRLDPATGSTLLLYDFPYPPPGSAIASPDGAVIKGRLLEVPPKPGNDIAIVGATLGGGSYSAGGVFRIDVAGDTPTFSKLHEFNVWFGPYLGEIPRAGLMRDPSDGALYGTTFGYGAAGEGVFLGPGIPASGELGTIFRIGADGVVSKLYSDTFIQPAAPLLLGSDGNIYSTTFWNTGAPSPSVSLGSIFKFSRPTQDPLTVTAPASAIYGTSFTVVTSGGSGTGAVTFEATGACSNVAGGDLITMTSGTGSCSISAAKAGDANYQPITSSPVLVTAVKAAQTITFETLPDKTLGDPPLTVAATGGASGNPVTFTTTTPAVCASGGTLGATITLATAGTCTVRASQAGDANYEPAADVDQSFLVQGEVEGELTFTGLFSPWAPPGPGTYNGVTFTSGKVYKMNSTLPVKWGYSVNGALVDSSRSTIAEYPVVNIQGPLGSCGDLDGTGSDAVVSYTGPGSTTTTYDPTTKTWQRNVTLDSSFQGDKCYMIQVSDPVSGTTSPWFPFKTKK